MGQYMSYNNWFSRERVPSQASEPPSRSLRPSRPLRPSRSGKWVKFSGSEEELARIALDYAKHQASKRLALLTQIKLSMSRRNGFNGQDSFDTVCDHWVWQPNTLLGDKLQLQAVNCPDCGNYVCVSLVTFPLPERIRCSCYNDLTDAFEEFREYECDESHVEPVVPKSIYLDYEI